MYSCDKKQQQKKKQKKKQQQTNWNKDMFHWANSNPSMPIIRQKHPFTTK